MIKYIGSKRLLVDQIVATVSALPDVRTVCDLFTGTTRVAQGLKKAGYDVWANDLASYSEVLGQAYVATDGSDIATDRIESMIESMNQVQGVPGYFTETFSERSRFFQPHNAMRIDAIRASIDKAELSDPERAILLVSLMEAADRVDSTTGVQMAYLKSWAPRSFNDLHMRMPHLIAGKGKATRSDANLLAPELGNIDVCYIDPPYNSHAYYSYYHIWETLIRFDNPETYGVACKRVDCQTTKSDYNFKRRSWDAFSDLIASLPCEYLVVSFNNEGFFSRSDIEELLLKHRDAVAVRAVDHKRYVGAQIGIHSPKGVRVGKVSHLRNQELLFVAGSSQRTVDAAAAATPDAHALVVR